MELKSFTLLVYPKNMGDIEPKVWILKSEDRVVYCLVEGTESLSDDPIQAPFDRLNHFGKARKSREPVYCACTPIDMRLTKLYSKF